MRLPRLWNRLNFSVKFATIIAVAGVLIAIIPLAIASRETGVQASQRAADKAGIAVNLIDAQQRSLASFAAGMAQELAGPLRQADVNQVATTLQRYSQINTPADVVGVDGPLDRAAVRAGTVLSKGNQLFDSLSAAAASAEHVIAGPDGLPWLVQGSAADGGDEVAFIARPVDGSLLRALDGTITTAADPAGIAVVRNGRIAVNGSTIVDQTVSAGSTVSSGVAAAVSTASNSQVVDVGGRQAGVDSQPLGAGFTVVVSTSVSQVSSLWQPVAILLFLIVVAMFFIVLVVQTDLQRPLRRLDRAVAALSRDEYDVPVPEFSDDEIGRLASSFEEMRRQLRATITSTRARAVIASELNAPQPLETALSHVCGQLRQSTAADAAFILVNGSEMTDSFAIAEGISDELTVGSLLKEEGPFGAAFRWDGSDALMVGAAPASFESRLGLRDFCAAPLRMARSTLGVLALARQSGGFTAIDCDLVSSSTEQVVLALERYRFLAMVQRQASIDDLTGLYNHRFLVDYLGQQVALAERLNTPLAILVIDLDHFKRVNDTYGHPVGDTVLSTFAQTLTRSVRRADLAARYGGEEFIVVMANTAAHDARRVAEKIRATAERVRVPVEGGGPPIAITVSIGCAAYPEDTTTARELLTTADAALYDAKRAGRNQVRMASEAEGRREATNVTSVVRPRRSAQ